MLFHAHSRVGLGRGWQGFGWPLGVGGGVTQDAHVADDTLRVELAVEEDNSAAGEEEPCGHEVLRLGVGRRLEPKASDDDDEGGDAWPTDPRVDRAVDAFLSV